MKISMAISAAFACATMVAAAAGPRRVAVFSGTGPMGFSFSECVRLMHDSPEVQETYIDEKMILNGILDPARFDVLVMPGGSPQIVKYVLKKEGAELVKDYLRKGGNYVGTCAGASLLMDDKANPERGMGFIPYTLAYRSDRMSQLPIELNEKGAKALGLPAKSYDMWYHGGPVLVPTNGDFPDAHVEIWGTFGDFGKPNPNDGSQMLGRGAVVGGTYGKGKLCATSCHPEYYPFSYPLFQAMFRYVTGREITFPTRKHNPRALTVGCYYVAAKGIECAKLLTQLDDNPDIDVQILDVVTIRRGGLDHVDVLLLPDGNPILVKLFFPEDTDKMMNDFMARGGKTFAWGEAVKHLPKGGVVVKDAAEALSKTLECLK